MRKNQAELTDDEKRRFINAVRKIKENGVYDEYVKIHEDHFSHGLHNNALFLPWHREYLRRFENELQSIDPSVWIPYWDWTVDRESNSDLWANNFLGQFNNEWNLQRTFSETLPTLTQVKTLISNNEEPYDVPNWDRNVDRGFRIALEGIHNIPHIWVGGSMASASSPADPVFWMHHSFVDRIWAMWMRENPDKKPYLPETSTTINAISEHGGRVSIGIDDPMHPWEDESNPPTPRSVINYQPYDSFALSDELIRV